MASNHGNRVELMSFKMLGDLAGENNSIKDEGCQSLTIVC
jgi:hypothetical protein